MLFINSNYREVLNAEYLKKRARNSSYSLRSFARLIQLDATQLSDVLRGKRGLSRKSATRIAQALGWSQRETECFCDQVESEHARSRVMREAAQGRVQAQLEAKPVNYLQEDRFKITAEWWHFAALQCMKLSSYTGKASWIAQRLGLPEATIQQALQRLERAELIEKRKGSWFPRDVYVFAGDGAPSDNIKKFHEDILQKAQSALWMQPVTERDFTSTFLPLCSKDVAEARSEIREFIQKFIEKFSNTESADRVYCLGTQFFNLTHESKKEGLQ